MEGQLVKENKCFTDLNLDSFKEELRAEFRAEFLELSFPIGSSYVTQTDVNPSTILGFGTWERVKGKVLVGLDEADTNFNEVGKTGGASTNTITKANIPNYDLTVLDSGHKHKVESIDNGSEYFAGRISRATNGSQKGFDWGNTDSVKTGIKVNSGGSGTAMNNLQPYQVIGYMWRRTA
jgi:hypothetical protein